MLFLCLSTGLVLGLVGLAHGGFAEVKGSQEGIYSSDLFDSVPGIEDPSEVTSSDRLDPRAGDVPHARNLDERITSAVPLLGDDLLSDEIVPAPQPSIPSFARTEGEGPHPLVVDDDREQCPLAGHATIQAAVSAATPGATIHVCTGTYREEVLVDRPVSLHAAGDPQLEAPEEGGLFAFLVDYAADFEGASTIEGFDIQGYGAGVFLDTSRPHRVVNLSVEDGTVGVTLDKVDGAVVSGLEARDVNAGVLLFGTDRVRIENATITGARPEDPSLPDLGQGIVGVFADESHMRGNELVDNHRGIQLAFSRSNVIEDNRVHNSSYTGVEMTGSVGNELRDNRLIGNQYNLRLCGCPNDVDTSNTVDGDPVLFLVGAEDRVIDGSTEAGFVGVVDGRNVTVRDLDLSHNLPAVLLSGTPSSRVENVTVSTGGIEVSEGSHETLVADNRVSTDDRSGNFPWAPPGTGHLTIGLYVRGSDGTQIQDNIVTDSGIGLWLPSTRDARVEGNHIEDGFVAVNVGGFEGTRGFQTAKNATLRDNRMAGNAYDLVAASWEGYVADSSDIDASNTVDGDPVVYLTNATDRTVDASTGAGYVALANVENVTVRDLEFADNGHGFVVSESADVHVENVSTMSVFRGATLHRTENTTVANTTVRDTPAVSTAHGLGAVYGSGARFVGNEIVDHDDLAVLLSFVDEGRVEDNRIDAQSQSTAVLFNAGNDNLLQDNQVTNATVGFFSIGADGTRIEDNRVHGTQSDLVPTLASDVRAAGNHLSGSLVGLLGHFLSGLEVEGNVLDGNEHGVFLSTIPQHNVVEDNRFLDNVNGTTVVAREDSYATITNNTFLAAANAGVLVAQPFDRNERVVRSVADEVHDNFIDPTGDYGVLNLYDASDLAVNATGNNWGDPTGPSSPEEPLEDPETGTLADGSGNTVSEGNEEGVSNVRFDPWVENVAPVLEPLEDVDIALGENVSIQAEASDLDGDPITLEASPLPSGAVFSDHGDGTGRLAWTPEKGQEDSYAVEFTAEDPRGLSASQAIAIRVFDNTAPTVSAPDNVQTAELETVSFTAQVDDPDGPEPVTWQVEESRDLDPEPTLTQTDDKITWSWRVPRGAGDVDVTFLAEDGVEEDANTTRVLVDGVPLVEPRRPVEQTTEHATRTLIVDEPVDLTASVTDRDGTIVDVQVYPRGTDDASLDAMEIEESTYGAEVSYTRPAEHQIVLEATDDDNHTTSAHQTVEVVHNTPPVVDAGEDVNVNATLQRGNLQLDGNATVELVGAANDPESRPLDASEHVWKLPPEATIDDDARTTTGPRLEHLFPVGTHDVQFSVTDANGATSTDTVQVLVDDALRLDAGLDEAVGSLERATLSLLVQRDDGSGVQTPVYVNVTHDESGTQTTATTVSTGSDGLAVAPVPYDIELGGSQGLNLLGAHTLTVETSVPSRPQAPIDDRETVSGELAFEVHAEPG